MKTEPTSDQSGIVITSREEAERQAGDVISLQILLDQTKARRDDELAKATLRIHAQYEKQIKETGELALAKSEAVKKWVAENRKEVLPAGQCFQTAVAEIGYRWTPPRLEPETGLTWRDVLKRILGIKRKSVILEDGTKVPFAMRFVRIKRETNVDQLKKDLLAELVDDDSRKAIGVRVKRDENFYICARGE